MKVSANRAPASTKSTQDVPSPAMIKKGNAILKAKLPDHFKSEGITSLVGHATFKSTGTPGVMEATGKLDVNALWGGDSKRSFTCLVNLNKGTISELKAK